jgi:hypothetical protein
MQLFCLGLCGSVGLVGVNVALYAQTEPKIFSILKEMLRWHPCEVSFEAFFLLFSSQNLHLGALV